MKSKKQPGRKIQWRVRVMMAERGVRTVTELVRLLEERAGVSISNQQLGRLIDGEPQHLNLDVIEGLMTVLDCELSELIR